MSEEKKKPKAKSKITSINITAEDLENPEMDAFLRESIKQEADELEARLNSDPSLVGVGASDDMFQAIVGKLKEQGVWEEEENSAEKEEKSSVEAIGEKRVEKSTEEGGQESADVDKAAQKEDAGVKLDEIYRMLPEEDRRALELGREVESKRQQKRRRARKWTKIMRRVGAAAAMLVIVFGVGMTSEANRRLVFKAWDAVQVSLGFRAVTDFVNEKASVEGADFFGQEMLDDIRGQMDIAVPYFSYMPEDMTFMGYEVSDDASLCVFTYFYQEKIFDIKVLNDVNESSNYYGVDNDAILRDTIVGGDNIEVEIWETNLDLPGEAYMAEFDYNECRYVLNGMIELEEFKKIIKYTIFL